MQAEGTPPGPPPAPPRRPWEADVREVLIDEERLSRRVRELAADISRDYAGRDLVVVGILKGAMLFLADLARHLTTHASFDFMAISSYGSATKSSGVVRILKDLDESVERRHVLIVEDIVDTGLTLKYLVELLRDRSPASLRVCALLEKPSRRRVEVGIDYCGFQVPDEFVVGYGLDYNQRYRHVPYIFVLKPEVYNRGGK